MSTEAGEAQTIASTATPTQLAAEAALLDARQSRLADVRAQLSAAGDAYAEAQAAAHARYQAAVGPLCAEVKELEATIERSEKAAAELAIRRQRVADLHEQLAAARQELPTEE